LVGGFAPDEGFRISIVMIEESSNRVLEFAGAAVNAPAQLLFSKQREPAFYQVKPGAPLGVKCRWNPRVPQQPTLEWLLSRR
jgi:hypothetical protein